MDEQQDITSDQPFIKVASEDSGDTIDQKGKRRKSILRVDLPPDSMLAVPVEQQRRPSKRVSFADEDGGEIQSVLQLVDLPSPQPQLPVRQSKCCQLW